MIVFHGNSRGYHLICFLIILKLDKASKIALITDTYLFYNFLMAFRDAGTDFNSKAFENDYKVASTLRIWKSWPVTLLFYQIEP